MNNYVSRILRHHTIGLKDMQHTSILILSHLTGGDKKLDHTSYESNTQHAYQMEPYVLEGWEGHRG